MHMCIYIGVCTYTHKKCIYLLPSLSSLPKTEFHSLVQVVLNLMILLFQLPICQIRSLCQHLWWPAWLSPIGWIFICLFIWFFIVLDHNCVLCYLHCFLNDSVEHLYFHLKLVITVAQVKIIYYFTYLEVLVLLCVLIDYNNVLWSKYIQLALKHSCFIHHWNILPIVCNFHNFLWN